jgi:two-component system, cell cycle sensor histidine kinase and response regulator CckA
MQNQKRDQRASTDHSEQPSFSSVEALFDSYPESVFLMECSGKIIKANKIFATRMGKSQQECIGKNVYDLLPPELVTQRRKKAEEIMRTGKRLSFEDERNNRTLLHTVYPSHSLDGRIDHLLIIAEDITELKKTRISLQNEQAFNNALIDATPGIFCLIDSEGRLAAWNPYLRDVIVGKPENEMSGVEALALIHPDERPQVHEKMQNIFIRDIEESIEARVLLRGGPEFRTLLFKGKRIIMNNKVMMVGIGTDITERKRTEEALIKSEQKFRTITENIAEMVFVTDNKGRFTYVSPAVEGLLGYAPEEVIDHTYREFITEEDIPKSEDAFAKLISNQSRAHSSEFRFRRKNHSIFWGEVHMQYFTECEHAGVIGILLDCNERKRIERMRAVRVYLLEMVECCSIEKILQAVLDEAERLTGSLTAYFHVVSDDQLFFSGHACSTQNKNEAWLKESSREPSAREIRGLLADVVREQRFILCNDSSTIRSSETVWKSKPVLKRTLAVPVKRGSKVMAIFELGNKASPYNAEDAQLIGVLGDITWDMVSKKRIEEDREKLQEQLQQSQKMEIVGQLAGGIAHDFNNMLAVILGHTELAIEKGDFSIEDLEAIRQAATRSTSLTRQLLTFARKQSVIPKVLDLNATIEGMLSMLRRLIGENISLGWIPETHQAWIKIDPSQIDQILANLCVNARDAINGTGKIIIETAVVHHDNLPGITGNLFSRPGDYVSLSISDNGCGIDKKNSHHIFEPFFTTKEPGKGTGMGLSTVYGIVHQNNGYIDFESEPGKGSRFRICLPLCEQHAAEQANLDPEPESAHGVETILLVEDEPAILKLCRIMLESKGYKVLAASAPSEAIQIADKYQGTINLLLTDVIMPEMNGTDLSRKLQSAYPDLKSLFMSGYTANIISDYGGVTTGVHLIEKPFSRNTLIKNVQEILENNN